PTVFVPFSSSANTLPKSNLCLLCLPCASFKNWSAQFFSFVKRLPRLSSRLIQHEADHILHAGQILCCSDASGGLCPSATLHRVSPSPLQLRSLRSLLRRDCG